MRRRRVPLFMTASSHGFAPLPALSRPLPRVDAGRRVVPRGPNPGSRATKGEQQAQVSNEFAQLHADKSPEGFVLFPSCGEGSRFRDEPSVRPPGCGSRITVDAGLVKTER